jgi:hypothetical protein
MHRRLAVRDPRANYLYFVRRDGRVQVHRLPRDSDWALTAAVLAGYERRRRPRGVTRP